MLLFPNALCYSLYERNCVCAVTKIFTKFLPANNFWQLLRVTRKRSCTSAGKAQAQLHFRDDQQRAFGISNISNWSISPIVNLDHAVIAATQIDFDLRLCTTMKSNPATFFKDSPKIPPYGIRNVPILNATNDWTKCRLFLPAHPGNQQSCLQEIIVMQVRPGPASTKLGAILCDQYERASFIQHTPDRVFL